MTYQAPLPDMTFVLEDLCGLAELAHLPGLADATPETVAAVLEEAARFASTVISPLNPVGDRLGLGFADGRVTTPQGWVDAYRALVDMGWNCPTARPEHGGMGLPAVVNACIQEMFSGANTAFQLCSMLTQGAVEAISHYASDELRRTYLQHLVSGHWTGTMNLTEPQAGSDLAAIRSRAVPEEQHYRIFGQKIFITYGDHDMAENIVHLVLARLPEAPAGVKGISLFLVPKVLVNPDGTLGATNDVRCVSIEHKLGIHGSPTCTLAFGDNGGAVGYLVGAPHQGLQYMFAMMNSARLGVGLQGVGIAELAGQKAAAFAAQRKQGSQAGVAGSVAIMAHPDVRRMLGLIKARTMAARILAYRAAAAQDIAHHSPDPSAAAAAQRRVDLLIPVVKGWATEMGNVSASLGVQVHGGMGFIEETGAAQILRDARITTIYEGTTGIQALDLIGRKLIRDQGQAMAELLADMKTTQERLASTGDTATDWPAMHGMIGEAIAMLGAATEWVLANHQRDALLPQASAHAMLELSGICTGAWAMADAALAAALRISSGDNSAHLGAKLRLAQFYRTQVFPQASALLAQLADGAETILALTADDLGAVT